MLTLMELSLTRAAVIENARSIDPLICSDLRACVKIWLASRPALSCRPWLCIPTPHGVRVVGWRNTDPDLATARPGERIGVRSFTLKIGDELSLAGEFVAVRRREHRVHDAAEGRQDAGKAYAAWLEERLMDLGNSARLSAVKVVSHTTESGLRKVRGSGETRSKRIIEVSYPVIRAEIAMQVRDPDGVKAWLLTGTGPHKAFGYGCFAPQAGAGV